MSLFLPKSVMEKDSFLRRRVFGATGRWERVEVLGYLGSAEVVSFPMYLRGAENTASWFVKASSGLAWGCSERLGRISHPLNSLRFYRVWISLPLRLRYECRFSWIYAPVAFSIHSSTVGADTANTNGGISNPPGDCRDRGLPVKYLRVRELPACPRLVHFHLGSLPFPN